MYRGVAVHANANAEHRAALQLLALVVAADNRLEPAEIETLREIADTWRDGSDFDFETEIRTALAAAREAMSTGNVVSLIEDIDSRISSRVLRSALYSAAQEVAESDNDVDPMEQSILAEVAVRFG